MDGLDLDSVSMPDGVDHYLILFRHSAGIQSEDPNVGIAARCDIDDHQAFLLKTRQDGEGCSECRGGPGQEFRSGEGLELSVVGQPYQV